MKSSLILSFVGLAIFSCGFAGCGSTPKPDVTVTITSPAFPEAIEATRTVNITAYVVVTGGSATTNINWSLSGTGCSGSACGTLTNETETSATYQAPPLVSADTTVSVTATSAADPSKSASIRIRVVAISVKMEHKVTEISAGPSTSPPLFARFTALPIADPQNQGVTWQLTADGTACSPGCGTLSTFDTIGAVYTPPASVPVAPNNAPTVTATSVTDPTKSDSDTFTIFDGATACGTGGNESELNGEYAVMLQGWEGLTNVLSGARGELPIVTAVSFGADGTGQITGGQGVFRGLFGSFGPIVPSASGYSVGPDNRGCLTLTDSFENTFTFQFSLGTIAAGIAQKGDVTEFDKQDTQPARASGILRRQDPSAFSLSSLAPAFALAVNGGSNTVLSPARLAIAGSFALADGNVSSPSFDVNDGGSLSSINQPGGGFGNIGPIATDTGMATATLDFPGMSPGLPNGTVFVINSSELFVVINGNSNGGIITLAGRAIATSDSLTPASIAPNYIFQSTGSSAGVASASIGLLNFSGGGASGTVSGKLDTYAVGTGGSQDVTGTYAFTSASGRLAVTGATSTVSPICYLTNPFDGVSAFCISTDSAASLGIMNAQPAATYDTSSLSGNFFFGSGEPADATVPDLSGIASISSGNLTGTEDSSSSSGLSLGTAINAALSINPDGTGTMGPNTVLVTNGTEIYFINEASGVPAAVQVFQQE